MPTTGLFRARAERPIAYARLILAAGSIVAVSLDPLQAGRASFATYGVLAGYLGASTAALVSPPRQRHRRSYGFALHAIDLGVSTALMYLTEGPTSPFFLLFNFTVLAATLRWRWRGALWTTAAVLLLFMFTGAVFRAWEPATFQPDLFIVRCAQLVAIGLLLVYFGLHRDRILDEWARLATWSPVPQEHEEGLPIRPILAYVAGVFRAPRVLLLWSDDEEPWTYVSEFTGQDYRQQQFPPGTFSPLLSPELTDSVFLVERTDGDASVLEPDGGIREGVTAQLDDSFRQSYGIGSMISIPVKSEAIEGRLFIVPSDLGPEDLSLATVLQTRINGVMDYAAAFDLWRRAAAIEERIRVARDLHDGVLQVLAGTSLQLQALAHQGSDGFAERIARLQHWLSHEQREFRSFIEQLEPGIARPRDNNFDLAADLGALAQTLEQQWGLRANASVMPPGAALPSELQYDLHHLVRESAANAARHGAASRLMISAVLRDNHLRLVIEDDGRGFPFQGHYTGEECQRLRIGPQSLARRVGKLGGTMTIGPGEPGARIRVEIPILSQAARSAA